MKLLNFGMDLGFVLAVAFAVIDRIDHEQGSDHEARDDSGKEQVADGSTGCHTVHDERDTRRMITPRLRQRQRLQWKMSGHIPDW